MCRMIGAVGKFDKPVVIKAADTMSKCLIGAHGLHRLKHLDGWGAVFRSEDGTLKRMRDEKAFSIENATTALAAVNTDMLVIHARHATSDLKGEEHVHPIECEIHGCEAYFFHNGSFNDGKKEIAWDTKALLDLLLPAFRSEQRDEEIRKAFAVLTDKTTSVNFILAERERLTVCNWYRKKDWAKYYTMHTLKTDAFSLVSSEVIPDLAKPEEWRAVENEAIFAIEPPGHSVIDSSGSAVAPVAA